MSESSVTRIGSEGQVLCLRYLLNSAYSVHECAHRCPVGMFGCLHSLGETGNVEIVLPLRTYSNTVKVKLLQNIHRSSGHRNIGFLLLTWPKYGCREIISFHLADLHVPLHSQLRTVAQI